MKHTIHKYPLMWRSKTKVQMPEGAEVLSAQMQNGVPVLLALVEPDERLDEREFVMYVTGEEFEIPEGCAVIHLDTLLLDGGKFVLHVFEFFRSKGEQ